MKIIAAIDGSDSSHVALNRLIGMNLPPDTEIKLLTVLKTEESANPLASKQKGAEETVQLKEEAETCLLEMIKELQAKKEAVKFSKEVLVGDAKGKIVEKARIWAADLVIMGSRGRKGMGLIFLGSVSQGVIMQASCPVIVVKDQEAQIEQENQGETEREGISSEGFKRILFTADNSAYSQAAFNWLRKMCWAKDVKFKIITVVPPLAELLMNEHSAIGSSDTVKEHDSLIAVADMELQILANELNDSFPKAEIITKVGEGDPREVILQMAQAWSADLIVMGSHGRTGLTRLLLGSVSQAVAVHSECSVAIIRGLVTKKQAEMQQTGVFTK